jgi:oxygen-dependent protoporphyrinogen oxidase
VLRFLFLWKLGSTSIQPQSEETLKTWSDRVLSSAVTMRLLGPACQGIFGVDAQPLSARLIFNYFFAKIPRARGKLRGSVAPEGGMGQWAEYLVQYLREKNVRFYFSQSSPMNFDQIGILATDLRNAVQILKQQNDIRADILSTVPLVDLVSVNVFYKQRPYEQAPGFGVLFSRAEKLLPLGVLFNSDIFSNRAKEAHSETWIFGSSMPELQSQSDEFFMESIKVARQKVWHASESPMEYKINRWPGAIPLYGLDLEKALTKLASQSHGKRLYLMGNYLGELGLNRLFHGAKSLLDSFEGV